HSFFSQLPTPPTSTLFPYTTLFRSFISSVAPPRGITTIGAIPGLRKAPLLRERQDGAALQPPGIAPAPYVLFRPEKQHGLSGERSEEHTSELQSRSDLVCRLLLEKK